MFHRVNVLHIARISGKFGINIPKIYCIGSLKLRDNSAGFVILFVRVSGFSQAVG